MRRRHLLELHDVPACPHVLRDGLTDFLQITIQRLDVYASIRPILLQAISQSGMRSVLDMCSGAGGPWLGWKSNHNHDVGAVRDDVDVTLTDKFPNEATRARVESRRPAGLRYLQQSIDVAAVPPTLVGFRTMFTSFHHFRPQAARLIIADAVAKRQPIGIFEFTYRHPAALAYMLLSPVAVWALTPLMPNRSLSKLFFTYVIPLIPLIVTFDGVVSCWRTYTVDELQAMTAGSDFRWVSGTRRSAKWPLPITYLIGYPPDARPPGR
jgi:hypothetical protein